MAISITGSAGLFLSMIFRKPNRGSLPGCWKFWRSTALASCHFGSFVPFLQVFSYFRLFRYSSVIVLSKIFLLVSLCQITVILLNPDEGFVWNFLFHSFDSKTADLDFSFFVGLGFFHHFNFFETCLAEVVEIFLPHFGSGPAFSYGLRIIAVFLRNLF